MKRASPVASVELVSPDEARSEGRRRNLITSALRGKILRALVATGEWNGQRKGVRMKFRRAVQGQLFDRPAAGLFDKSASVEWRAFAGGKWHQGKAGTVWDACQAIELL